MCSNSTWCWPTVHSRVASAHCHGTRRGLPRRVARGVVLSRSATAGSRTRRRGRTGAFPRSFDASGGYNLDAFVTPADRPADGFDMTRMIVGSEGTIAVVLEARIALVPLPRAKAVMTIQFADLLGALAATPAILAHHPSAVEVMDLHPRQHETEPGPRSSAPHICRGRSRGAPVRRDVRRRRRRTSAPSRRTRERSSRPAASASTSTVRSTAQVRRRSGACVRRPRAVDGHEEDAKSLSFVEDTAVAPERLRDYIERYSRSSHRHGTVAGAYAHASSAACTSARW